MLYDTNGLSSGERADLVVRRRNVRVDQRPTLTLMAYRGPRR